MYELPTNRWLTNRCADRRRSVRCLDEDTPLLAVVRTAVEMVRAMVFETSPVGIGLIVCGIVGIHPGAAVDVACEDGDPRRSARVVHVTADGMDLFRVGLVYA